MKTFISLLTLSICFTISAFGQTTASVDSQLITNLENRKSLFKAKSLSKTTTVIKSIEQEIAQQLQSIIEYPEIAYEYKIEGTVVLEFTFDGTAKDAKIIASVGAGCDKAALKAFNQISNDYKNIEHTYFTPIKVKIPVQFKL